MVPSSADIVLQNRRISQSEPSTINICDVVNTTNYFVVVVLPSRQIKRVARPAAYNYERCVFVTIFSG